MTQMTRKLYFPEQSLCRKKIKSCLLIVVSCLDSFLCRGVCKESVSFLTRFFSLKSRRIARDTYSCENDEDTSPPGRASRGYVSLAMRRDFREKNRTPAITALFRETLRSGYNEISVNLFPE